MAIASNTNNCKPCYSKKGTCSKKFKKVVPYEEMERLMNVYGALKAVRNRSAKSSKKEDSKKDDKGEDKGNGCQVKRESIKRKFYRWFPDLEQRFIRTEDGQYQPIHGHEQEVNYRKQMREKSFESVAQKRARANQRNNYLKKERGELPRGDQPLPELISSSGAVYIPPPPPSKKVAFEAAIITSCLVSEDEEESSIIDNFFHASGSIFDEVNQEFYGEELPSSSSIEEIDFTNFNEENNALEGIVIGSGSSSSSSWEDDLELFGDGLLGILEDGSV